jgi:hypothetical protein
MCAANRAKVAKYAASLETHPTFRQPVFFRISVLLVPAASALAQPQFQFCDPLL